MSIDTTGLIEADNFQGTAAQAGFVKNDASGNLLLGETGSAWTLIETFVAPSDITDFTFAAVLDGDVDYQYRIIYTAGPFVTVAGTRIFLRPNGVTTGQLTLSSRWGFDPRASFSTPNLVLAQVVGLTAPPGVASTMRLYGDFDFTAHTGQQRILNGDQAEQRPLVSRTNGYLHWGKWSDTTTNITSLKVETDGLGFIPSGSEWALYKVKRV